MHQIIMIIQPLQREPLEYTFLMTLRKYSWLAVEAAAAHIGRKEQNTVLPVVLAVEEQGADWQTLKQLPGNPIREAAAVAVDSPIELVGHFTVLMVQRE